MKIPNKKPINEEQNEEEEVIDIDNKGPSVASFKNNKLTIIIISSFLIAVTLYLFFFRKSQDNANEKIEPVVPQIATISPNDTGKSIFEFEKTVNKKEVQDPELLKPQADIEIPSLPELPKEMVLSQQLDLSPNQTEENKSQNNQDQQNQNNLNANNNPNQNLNKLLNNQPDKTTEQQAINKNQELINQQIINDQKIAQQNNQIIANSNLVQKNIKLDPRYTPIIVYSGGEASQGQSVGSKDNIIQVNKNPINDLKEEVINVDAKLITNSQTTIAQGKLINAILETAIDTQMPGIVRAVISRDIFGESGNKILIPRGSRLYGSYSSEIQRGQARVKISWTRLIRPDGVSLNINFEASDQFGRAGVPGDLDNRFSAVITNSILSSILTVGGVAIAQRLVDNSNVNNTTTVNQNQGITTTTTNATNQAIVDVTKTIVDTIGKIISNTLVLTPVIKIPQGTKITVIVNADVRLPPVISK
jgi:type IV secretory pathway VirB10-like protein